MTDQPIASYAVDTSDADQTRALGEALGRVLAAGDLVMLSGGLGAGKTTLTQGIGIGMGVRGRVASPTFIVARVHPALGGGPDLIHADAYRITDLNDLETLDLDSSLDEAVTVVEWGEGKTEAMSEERLAIEVRRRRGGQAQRDGDVIDLEHMDDGRRRIILRAHGHRWDGVLDSLVAAHGGTRLDQDALDSDDHTDGE
jgi:hydrolase, P-loop family